MIELNVLTLLTLAVSWDLSLSISWFSSPWFHWCLGWMPPLPKSHPSVEQHPSLLYPWQWHPKFRRAAVTEEITSPLTLNQSLEIYVQRKLFLSPRRTHLLPFSLAKWQMATCGGYWHLRAHAVPQTLSVSQEHIFINEIGILKMEAGSWLNHLLRGYQSCPGKPDVYFLSLTASYNLMLL